MRWPMQLRAREAALATPPTLNRWRGDSADGRCNANRRVPAGAARPAKRHGQYELPFSVAEIVNGTLVEITASE